MVSSLATKPQDGVKLSRPHCVKTRPAPPESSTEAPDRVAEAAPPRLAICDGAEQGAGEPAAAGGATAAKGGTDWFFRHSAHAVRSWAPQARGDGKARQPGTAAGASPAAKRKRPGGGASAGKAVDEAAGELAGAGAGGAGGAEDGESAIYDAVTQLADLSPELLAMDDVLLKFKKYFAGDIEVAPQLAALPLPSIQKSSAYGKLIDEYHRIRQEGLDREAARAQAKESGEGVDPLDMEVLLDLDGPEYERAVAQAKYLKVQGQMESILAGIDKLSWEGTINDFISMRKFSDDSDAVVMDLQGRHWDNFDQISHILKLSKLSMEDALCTHSWVSSDHLLKFYEKVAESLAQAAQGRAPPGDLEGVQRQLDFLRSHRERSMKHLVSNASQTAEVEQSAQMHRNHSAHMKKSPRVAIVREGVHQESASLLPPLTSAPGSPGTAKSSGSPQAGRHDSPFFPAPSARRRSSLRNHVAKVVQFNATAAKLTSAMTREDRTRTQAVDVLLNTLERSKGLLASMEGIYAEMAALSKKLEELVSARFKARRIPEDPVEYKPTDTTYWNRRLQDVKKRLSSLSMEEESAALSVDQAWSNKDAGNENQGSVEPSEAPNEERPGGDFSTIDVELRRLQQEHSLQALDTELRELRYSCKEILSEVKKGHGSEAWSLQMGGAEGFNVHFLKNPRELLLPTLEEMLHEIRTLSPVSESGDLDSLASELETILTALSEEREERRRSKDEGVPYKDKGWSLRTIFALDNLIRRLARRYKVTKMRASTPQDGARPAGLKPSNSRIFSRSSTWVDLPLDGPPAGAGAAVQVALAPATAALVGVRQTQVTFDLLQHGSRHGSVDGSRSWPLGASHDGLASNASRGGSTAHSPSPEHHSSLGRGHPVQSAKERVSGLGRQDKPLKSSLKTFDAPLPGDEMGESRQPSGQFGQQSIGRFGRQSMGQSVRQSMGQPGRQSIGQSGHQSMGQPGRESVEGSGWQSMGQSGWQPMGQSGWQSMGQSGWQPMGQAGQHSMGQSGRQSQEGSHESYAGSRPGSSGPGAGFGFGSRGSQVSSPAPSYGRSSLPPHSMTRHSMPHVPHASEHEIRKAKADLKEETEMQVSLWKRYSNVQQDLSRLMAEFTGPRNKVWVEMKESMEKRWKEEMETWTSQLSRCSKDIVYWKTRLRNWYTNLKEEYGEEIAQAVLGQRRLGRWQEELLRKRDQARAAGNHGVQTAEATSMPESEHPSQPPPAALAAVSNSPIFQDALRQLAVIEERRHPDVESFRERRLRMTRLFWRPNGERRGLWGSSRSISGVALNRLSRVSTSRDRVRAAQARQAGQKAEAAMALFVGSSVGQVALSSTNAVAGGMRQGSNLWSGRPPGEATRGTPHKPQLYPNMFGRRRPKRNDANVSLELNCRQMALSGVSQAGQDAPPMMSIRSPTDNVTNQKSASTRSTQRSLRQVFDRNMEAIATLRSAADQPLAAVEKAKKTLKALRHAVSRHRSFTLPSERRMSLMKAVVGQSLRVIGSEVTAPPLPPYHPEGEAAALRPSASDSSLATPLIRAHGIRRITTDDLPVLPSASECREAVDGWWESMEERTTEAIRCLRRFRRRMERLFDSMRYAYWWVTKERPGLTYDALKWLARHCGLQDREVQSAAAFLFQIYGLAPGREQLSREQFLEALRYTRPVGGLGQLRGRLRRRFGGLRAAFAAAGAAGKSKSMSERRFVKLLELVVVDVAEARYLFGRMLLHSRQRQSPAGRREVTRETFLLTLVHAEGLIAAQRMCSRIRRNLDLDATVPLTESRLDELTTGVQSPRSGGGGGGSPRVNSDTASLSWLGAVEKKFLLGPLTAELLGLALGPLGLLPGDAAALLKLAQRVKRGPAGLQDVAVVAISYGCGGVRQKILAGRGGEEFRRLQEQLPAKARFAPKEDGAGTGARRKRHASSSSSGLGGWGDVDDQSDQAELAVPEKAGWPSKAQEPMLQEMPPPLSHEPTAPASAPTASVTSQPQTQQEPMPGVSGEASDDGAVSSSQTAPQPAAERTAVPAKLTPSAPQGHPQPRTFARRSTLLQSHAPEPRLEVVSKQAQEQDRAGQDADEWAFEEEELSSDEEWVDQQPTWDEQLAVCQDVEQARLHEAAEAEEQRRRLSLFGGDEMELQIAMQKLREFQARLLRRFRSPQKAFLAVTSNSPTGPDLLSRQQLRERTEKLLSFNPLDADRIVEVFMACSSSSSTTLTLEQFVRALRLASPVPSLQHFRTRLVQQYWSVEGGLRVLGLVDRGGAWGRGLSGSDVGLFERALLGAAICQSDAQRLFRVADAAQPGGSTGHLTTEGLRFVLKHAHTLASLETFQAFCGSLQQLPVGSPSGEDAALQSVNDLREALKLPGFPSQLVPPLFALLEGHIRPLQHPVVTLRALVNLVRRAFPKSGSPLDASLEAAARPPAAAAAAPPQGRAPSAAEEAGGGGGAGADESGEEALQEVIKLRRFVRSAFKSYEGAFRAICRRDMATGPVLYKEWKEAREVFGFGNDHSWEVLFKHLAKSPPQQEKGQQLQLQLQHRGALAHISQEAHKRGVTLRTFAVALERAAKCRSLAALRARMEEQHGSLQGCWAQLAGKAAVEEVQFVQWRSALQQLGVPSDDAGRLWGQVMVAPTPERGAVLTSSHQLSRSAFLGVMHCAEAVSVLLDLAQRLSRDPSTGVSGSVPVSMAFENRVYPSHPLSREVFEDQLRQMFGLSAQDARAMFVLLDAHRDGVVAVPDVLSALTTMQGAYLPYAWDKRLQALLEARQQKIGGRSTSKTGSGGGRAQTAEQAIKRQPGELTLASGLITSLHSAARSREGARLVAAEDDADAAKASKLATQPTQAANWRPWTSPAEGNQGKAKAIQSVGNEEGHEISTRLPPLTARVGFAGSKQNKPPIAMKGAMPLSARAQKSLPPGYSGSGMAQKPHTSVAAGGIPQIGLELPGYRAVSYRSPRG